LKNSLPLAQLSGYFFIAQIVAVRENRGIQVSTGGHFPLIFGWKAIAQNGNASVGSQPLIPACQVTLDGEIILPGLPAVFGTGKVIRVNPIAIRYFRQPENSYSYARGNKFVEVTMNGAKLTRMECEELAQNDGFGSFEEFLDWFDSDFNGSIIFWSNFEEQNHE
jgi:hypothetical protein